ncbi:MAG: 3-deoxy-8-phosphooctulonate synthase [Helicobacteraceae bacterium]|jgi:2-dehydro-3-deoxyphosphooctonate aldolase (KDO 8-P synthase)|nr:3-deoxy-8-phosphooctulonate synthase [Helicobacteraceae bacterium]
MRHIRVASPGGGVFFSNELPLSVIAGPCVIESEEFALRTAERLKMIFDELKISFVYKSSFDKANRSSAGSFRGVGMDEGLRILEKTRREVGVPTLTDVHTIEQAKPTSEVVDMLQTPAFLCRQTDFIQAVAATNKPINIKKGQFLSPWEMTNVLSKAVATGNSAIALCERGTSFGYNNLVVDMRSLAVMAKSGHPVIFDATHSVQLPGAGGTSSDGQREFASSLACAAVAVKVAGVFIETHPDPDLAPCDGPNMIAFSELAPLLRRLKAIDEVVKRRS